MRRLLQLSESTPLPAAAKQIQEGDDAIFCKNNHARAAEAKEVLTRSAAAETHQNGDLPRNGGVGGVFACSAGRKNAQSWRLGVRRLLNSACRRPWLTPNKFLREPPLFVHPEEPGSTKLRSLRKGAPSAPDSSRWPPRLGSAPSERGRLGASRRGKVAGLRSFEPRATAGAPTCAPKRATFRGHAELSTTQNRTENRLIKQIRFIF